jgi:hypothetical protein
MQLKVPKANLQRTDVIHFKKWLVHQQFACLRACFDAFNANGGAVVKVNGKMIHFSRSTILALYGDHPACVKSTLTGSACPRCFIGHLEFANVHAMSELRTERNMDRKCEEYKARIAAGGGGVSDAKAKANYEGVHLTIRNGWISPLDVPSCFGVDPDLDNVHGNSPSVMLHAFDEGQEKFGCEATIEWAIHDGAARGLAAAQVTRMIDAGLAATCLENPQNSNVEVNGRDAFQLFPHGVVDYLRNKKRLNANWYGPLRDQLQYFLMGADILTPAHKKQMCDLAHMQRQIHFMIRQPLDAVTGVRDYHDYLEHFVQNLIRWTIDHSPSECNSIKYHAARHWADDRTQLGCSAMEYSLERALGDHFTKFWPLTNHGRHKCGTNRPLLLR